MVGENAMNVATRTALVTGAAQGIGLAIARRLAEQGVHSLIADINGDKAEEAAISLRADGLNCSSVALDVSCETAIADAMGRITGELGLPIPLILVNNAGIPADSPALDGPLANWYRCLDVMLTGPLLLARAVAPAMIAARWGRIINMGSMMTFTAFGRDTGYCAAKAGLLGLTRSLAADLAPHDICVNMICPGNIMTDLMAQTAQGIEERDGLPPGSFLAERPKSIPMKRLGTPDDVARLAAFLASDAGDYTTGQAIHVNGGLYYH
jgi:NAD(P)-dependent dehydrogenase (short-subunit alcohol dehydrogenase family)